MVLPDHIGHAPSNREPLVCAVTGELVRGRHAVTFYLRDGYFYRVLNKALERHDEALREQIAASLDLLLDDRGED